MINPKSGIGAGLRVTIIGSIVNVLLVIFKLWAGYVARSQALIADGVHSLSDLFSDFVVICGLKWGRKGADADHPYGHARIETISGMIVGITLILVGLGIAYSAISAIYQQQPGRPGLFALYAAAASIILKEAMYWYTIVVGRRLGSMVLVANAWHHRSDAFSSLAVLIGVGATRIRPEWYLADAIAALVVTFFIIKIGGNLVWSAFRELADTAPRGEVVDQLKASAGEVPGVLNVHDLRARFSGPQILVELHIVVDPRITVERGHLIADAVRDRLLAEFSEVTRVTVHVDPARVH